MTPPADDDVVVISQNGYPVDPNVLPNENRVPQTPPPPGSRKEPFPPLPPRGSMARQGLAAPRAPRWAVEAPTARKARPHASMHTTAKWFPKQTTAPIWAAGTNPGKATSPWGRGVPKEGGKGRRPGHWNEEGKWEGRNKGRMRKQWPANQ